MEHHPEDYNEYYRSFKFKDKLVNHFGTSVSFWQASTSRSQLVYASAIHKGQAIEVAFELVCSDEKRLEEAAMILRRHIYNEKHQSGSDKQHQPFLLEEFLSFVISGKPQKNASRKSKSTNSFNRSGYMLCSNQWRMGYAQGCFIAHDHASSNRKCRVSNHFKQIWTWSVLY